MTGKITIENMTHNGYRHNFEIVIAADKNELTGKMEFNDKAIAELTKSVEPQFDLATGTVTLKASLAAHADIGPYEFRVEADAPNHFTYTFKPESISAIVEKGKRRYKYSAEIAFKVDITLHPTPKNKQPEIVLNPQRESAPEVSKETVGRIGLAGIIVAYVLIIIFGPKGPITRGGGPVPRFAPASNMPFIHQINPNDPRLRT